MPKPSRIVETYAGQAVWHPAILAPMRKRRIFKWVGLVVCSLCLLAFLTSLRWTPRCSIGSGVVFLEAGRVKVEYWGFSSKGDQELCRSIWKPPSFVLEDASNLPWSFWFVPSHLYVGFPVWIPFVLIAVPTIVAWRRDRRFPPGHCQKCGYDLTGNESGVCSECGTECAKE